ncbi:N-acyl-D-amino-acid deacylase family protein [Mucilaginibacter sp.]
MRKPSLWLIICLFPLQLLAQAKYDVLLKNGKIIDGTGNPWFYGDIGITGNKIAAIGNLINGRATKVINAKGLIIAPGFIDVHTHIEGDEKATPTADNFIYDGVTTVITGNCGESNINIKSYLHFLDSLKLSVNTATLIGHNDVRKAVLGAAAVTPTPAQLNRMTGLVEQAMRDGAFGFSTGLIYTPGIYSKTPEVIALAKAAAKYKGLYASHMRNETDKIFEAITEAIDVGRQAQMPVEISHYKVGRPNWGCAPEMLQMVDNARKEGLDVTVDQYPYTASSTTLSVLLPDWLQAGGRDSLLQRLADPTLHQKAVNEMAADMQRRQLPHFDYAVVANCSARPALNGKSITQINITNGQPSTIPDEIETILNIIKLGGADMVFHGLSEADVALIMSYPLTMVASDSGIRRFGKGVPHPRGYGSNARVLGLYVRHKGLLRLEDAVRKMTSLPAQKFHLQGRGLLRPGMYADIAVFDAGQVTDLSTFERPHAYSAGFKYILVNGKLTVNNFKHIGTRNGTVLYGPGYHQIPNTL